MAGTTLDIHKLIEADTLGASIASKWQTWSESYRSKWIEEKKELRNYLYATDTSTTSNSSLPWANSTTTPKLTQIYDNLKANYAGALFPNADWLKWQASQEDSDDLAKALTIQSYMTNKLEQSDFRSTADQFLDDWIQTGNVFGTVEWVEDYAELPDGEVIYSYIGPRAVRISPYDIAFDPTAAHWKDTPKIVRSINKLGEVRKRINAGEEQYQAIFDKMLDNRRQVSGVTNATKSDGYIADGFNSIQQYYGSDFVEILTFTGDIYDVDQDILYENYRIVVADRSYIIEMGPIPSWLGHEPIYHSAWRTRPDNLYGMGPLDNLVGMQYRIDHLENLKADVFDQIAFPMVTIQGDVADFDSEPGARIYLGEEGAVGYLHPPATALNADFQIDNLSNKMEEMAGAPRQAMGFRTPGEKTAFEVSALENASGRIFNHKAEHLERGFISKIMNAMLESSRRNMDTSDTIRVLDDATGLAIFETITRADLAGNGRLKPVGASHFAERAQRVQNLLQMMQAKADPTVGVHLSGQKIAEIIAMELGERELYGENIAVQEQLATQTASQNAEATNAENLQVAAEIGA